MAALSDNNKVELLGSGSSGSTLGTNELGTDGSTLGSDGSTLQTDGSTLWTDELGTDGPALGTNGPTTGVEVLLTENIRKWIRTVLLTSDLPGDAREELRKYTATRRASGDDKKPRTIPFQLIKSVHGLQSDKGVYLHELLEGSDIHIPEVELPPRNAVLEARVQRLKAEQAQRDYDHMTSNLKTKMQRKNTGDESIGTQLRLMNIQLLSVFNFVVTVVGSFVFAYKATEYSLEKPNFAVQLLTGLCAATVVFIADMYFLIRYSQ